MASLLEKLPTILVLAVLVAIFVSLRRHANSVRMQLWVSAWVLIFLHFFVQIFEPCWGTVGAIISGIDLGALALAGLLFVVSLSIMVGNKSRRRMLLALLGIPTTVYIGAASFDIDQRWLYALCLLTIFYGGAGFVAWHRRKQSLYAFFLAAILIATGTWSIHAVVHRNYDLGLLALLSLAFGLPGILFWRRYQRWSPGVITVTGGFLLWGAVFPAGAFTQNFFPHLAINPELWNVPKYFVAFGMILTILEDKSRGVEEASLREHAINQQLQRFSRITSRLLNGINVDSVCDEIAAAIAETSNFQRVAILLCNEDQSLYVSGSHGIAPGELTQLKKKAASWSTKHIAELCSLGKLIGQASYIFKSEQITAYDPLRSKKEFEANPYWENGDEILVPLQSSRGAYVGNIGLNDPIDVTRVNHDEISRIELIAGDLAVTVENAALHRQLVRSEKLAGLGQLVAGVAHELNNPLAAVVGYSELLSDEVSGESARQKIDKLLREATRMKSIIENLLRFARQNSGEERATSVPPLLREVMMLREYHVKNRGVEIQTQIDSNLPQVAISEDEFKQILLNLLNNAVDAIEDLPRKIIRVECMAAGERVMIRFEDNGPGFANLERAFDPFYTTKPVGKGTGLGLSICYGIIKERGGEIFVRNLEPCGASVVVELPIVSRVGAATG